MIVVLNIVCIIMLIIIIQLSWNVKCEYMQPEP